MNSENFSEETGGVPLPVPSPPPVDDVTCSPMDIVESPLTFLETAYVTREADIAEKLGVDREHMRTFRREHLEKGIDYALVKKNYTYTEAAVQRAFEHFLTAHGQHARGGRDTAFPRQGPEVEAEICTVYTNPGLVMAYHPEFPAPIRVRVHRSNNWLKGMMIPVVHEAGDMYRCNHAAPRQKGKW